MKAAVICDLDGTLYNIEHRLHYVRNGGKDWDGFFNEIPGDEVVPQVRVTLACLKGFAGFATLLTTGRPEKCRHNTSYRLDHDMVPYDKMYMRPDTDRRKDHVVKREMLDQIRADGYEPFLVIDDRPSVVQMWREAGLICLQCAPTPPFNGEKQGLLTLMVGPSGAGKTEWLRSCFAQDYGVMPSQVISSDATREELCGDFRDQSRNDDVFEAVHALAKARLLHGLPATIDATHIRRKDRLAAVGVANGGPVHYLVINRPLERKLEHAGWRRDVPGLIERHDHTFRSQLDDILRGDDQSNVRVGIIGDDGEIRPVAKENTNVA